MNASSSIALRLMTWTNNFSKTFLIFASLIPFFRLIIPEKCFYQWILCHNFVYMKKFPWFLSFELGARQACDRRHRTMGTVHSGKISHLTQTFPKRYLRCPSTAQYSQVQPSTAQYSQVQPSTAQYQPSTAQYSPVQPSNSPVTAQ